MLPSHERKQIKKFSFETLAVFLSSVGLLLLMILLSFGADPIASILFLGTFGIGGGMLYMMSQGMFPNKTKQNIADSREQESHPNSREQESHPNFREQESRPKKQITLRLDAALFDQLEELAEKDLRSLNNQIEYMLKKSLQQHKDT